MQKEDIKILRFILKHLKKDFDNLVIRNFISSIVSNYNENQTYIIYDGNKIEVFNESALELKKDLHLFKSYLISKPLKSISLY